MECELVDQGSTGVNRSIGPQRSAGQQRYQPYIVHPRRQNPLPFNGFPSGKNFGISAPVQKKPPSEAEKELKDSSTKLLGAVLGRFADSADHQQRFEKEVNSSKTVNSLIEEQLTFVADLHPLVQTTLLICEKFYRTKTMPE